MRRIISIFLLAIVLVMMAFSVSAESSTNLILRMWEKDNPIPGATFEIYRVGAMSADGKLVLSDEFKSYPVDLNDHGEDTSPQAAILYAYARKDGIKPIDTTVTNESGHAVTDSLKDGLYMIAGQPFEYDGYRYQTKPQLLLLPQNDLETGEVLKEPILMVKFSSEKGDNKTTSRKVLKIWNDNNSKNRPTSLTVHLLKDGKIHHTVTLNEKNQWRYVWDNLDANAHWQILEDVPKGYYAEMEQEGKTFHLTNTAQDTPDPKPTEPTKPGGGKIDQTGMVLWPVLLLAGCGMLFVVVGIVLCKESAYES